MTLETSDIGLNEARDYRELLKWCHLYLLNEPRDASYRLSAVFLDERWGNIKAMCETIENLMFSWMPQIFYIGKNRPAFANLPDCISKWLDSLSSFRRRCIDSLENSDEDSIGELFWDFKDALKNGRGQTSDVAAGKALGLLAPEFFPLWDSNIQVHYQRYDYFSFQCLMREFWIKIVDSYPSSIREEGMSKIAELYCDMPVFGTHFPKTLLKMIDEYNYAKYTLRLRLP